GSLLNATVTEGEDNMGLDRIEPTKQQAESNKDAHPVFDGSDINWKAVQKAMSGNGGATGGAGFPPNFDLPLNPVVPGLLGGPKSGDNPLLPGFEGGAKTGGIEHCSKHQDGPLHFDAEKEPVQTLPGFTSIEHTKYSTKQPAQGG